MNAEGNAREVEELRALCEKDLDLRRLVLVSFEKDLGWLTAFVLSSSYERVRLLIELPPGYPDTEPPRFFFPNAGSSKLLENLRHAVQTVSVVFQRNKRKHHHGGGGGGSGNGGGRCLEDCLTYICRALQNANNHHEPVGGGGGGGGGTLTAASSFTDVSASWTSQMFHSGALHSTAGSQMLLSRSHVQLQTPHHIPHRAISLPVSTAREESLWKALPVGVGGNGHAGSSGLGGLIRRTRADSDKSSITSSGNRSSSSSSSSNNNDGGNPRSNTSAAPDLAQLLSRPRRCGASFGGGNKLVVFTAATRMTTVPSSASNPHKARREDSVWDSDLDDEEEGGGRGRDRDDDERTDGNASEQQRSAAFHHRRGESSASSISSAQQQQQQQQQQRLETFSVLSVVRLPMRFVIGSGAGRESGDMEFDAAPDEDHDQLAVRLAWSFLHAPDNVLAQVGLGDMLSTLARKRDMASLAMLRASTETKAQECEHPSSLAGFSAYLQATGDFVRRIDVDKLVRGANALDAEFTWAFPPHDHASCVVCRLALEPHHNSLVTMCPKCAHGFHANACLSDWFGSGESLCPSPGCGCACV